MRLQLEANVAQYAICMEYGEFTLGQQLAQKSASSTMLTYSPFTLARLTKKRGVGLRLDLRSDLERSGLVARRKVGV